MKMQYGNKAVPSLKPSVRKKASQGLRLVAAWAMRNQVRDQWPRWNANTGRFPYHVYLPTEDHFLSTSWNTARTVQGLLNAYQVLGDRHCLAAAERGLAYVKSLQVFAPEHPRVRGAFIEETPLNDHVGVRDSVECTQALMSHYFLTRDKTSLLRAEAFLDWALRHAESDEWPYSPIYILPRYSFPRTGNLEERRFLYSACAIPWVQCAKVTGKKAYVTRGAGRQIDYVIRELQQADGSYELPKPPRDFHAPFEDRGTIVNDDGIGVSTLCVWRATGKRKYLDSAAAFADWWLNQELDALPRVYAMYTPMLVFLTDIARATGDARYVDFINDSADRVFDLQIRRDERPLVAGAFRGEDMARTYRAGSTPDEYISLRSTSYGLLALSKLAAKSARQWGPSYSAFGF